MVINVAPVKFSNSPLLKRVTRSLEQLFTAEIKLINLSLNLDKTYSADRKQYYSTALIADAIPKTESYEGKVVLLVEFDLFVPVFTFLFGEAQLDGKHAIVSVTRLHEDFYSGRSDEELLYQRTMKEVLHELGHTFGLIHCSKWDCAMHSSKSIEEVDIKSGAYCDDCAAKVPAYKNVDLEFVHKNNNNGRAL